MNKIKEYLDSKGITQDTLIVNGDALRNWVYSQQDIIQSTMNNLELREGLRNDYYRGKLDAYDEILRIIEK